MEKRALQLTSVASMIDQFTIPNIRILQSMGFKVDVVADFKNPGNISADRSEDLKHRLNDMGVDVFDIAIPRSLNPAAINSAYKEVKALLDAKNYGILHCHSPIGGVIARKAAKSKRKNGLKVIYTAHGFHFYDGAPLKNWMLFYPVEKHYSRYTDILITINNEDYNRAKTKLHAGKTYRIPGVGVDTARFAECAVTREEKRNELGLSPDDFVLISVGELNVNKNHQVVIRAIKDIPQAKYVIVGIGKLKDELISLSKELGVSDRVSLLGYMTDINELLHMSDCFAFPSLREGLGLAAIEALSAGLPVIASNVGGISDYTSSDTGVLCSGHSVEEYSQAIKSIMDSDREAYSIRCRKKAAEFDISVVDKIMTDIYSEVSGIQAGDRS